MSDQLLSTLNLLLQWIAVIGTVFALLSSVGLIFARREISRRQAVALAAANSDAAAARQLAGDLGKEVETVKRYSYLATLTFNGMVYTGGDVIMPTPISQSVAGTWSEISQGQFRPVCEAAALEKSREGPTKGTVRCDPVTALP